MKKHGYHLTDIPKAKLGTIDKIKEEYDEFIDAHKQGCLIMELIELSDLVGAIDFYLKKYNLGIEDVLKFSNITKRAFESGERK